MSWRKRCRSKSIEALISSMTASGPSLNRPPHMRFFMNGPSGNQPREMSDKQGTRRAAVLIGIAAVAGILAGTVAVYVRGSGDGNVAGADSAALADCAGVVAAAAKLDPLGDRARSPPSASPTAAGGARQPRLQGRRTARTTASPPSTARSCWSIFGRRGACPAGRRCRRSTGCRRRWAATPSRSRRSTST